MKDSNRFFCKFKDTDDCISIPLLDGSVDCTACHHENNCNSCANFQSSLCVSCTNCKIDYRQTMLNKFLHKRTS